MSKFSTLLNGLDHVSGEDYRQKIRNDSDAMENERLETEIDTSADVVEGNDVNVFQQIVEASDKDVSEDVPDTTSLSEIEEIEKVTLTKVMQAAGKMEATRVDDMFARVSEAETYRAKMRDILSMPDTTFSDRRALIKEIETVIGADIKTTEYELILEGFHELYDDDHGVKWLRRELTLPIAIWGRNGVPFPSHEQEEAMKKWGFNPDGSVTVSD